MEGGELDCQGYELSGASTARRGILMRGSGSKVTNCKVVDFRDSCISMKTASSGNPHMIVGTNVSNCEYGFRGEKALGISIASSKAERNNYGIFLDGTGLYTLSNVVSSNNNLTNMEFIDRATVTTTNVIACNSSSNVTIFNDGAIVTSSSLTCDQDNVVIEDGGTSITCNNPCSALEGLKDKQNTAWRWRGGDRGIFYMSISCYF
jgi:hypothetical protein